MEGRPEAEPLLCLAERAERLGYDSVWVGDSLLARPRHEPITLLAGVAGRTRRVRARHGRAAAGAAQSRAARAPGCDARPGQRRPGDPRRRHRHRRSQYPGRVPLGRRAVREARRHVDGRHAALQGAVDRQAGGLGRPLARRAGRARPDAAPARRAADLGRRLGAGRAGAGGEHFDGWFPTGPDAKGWGEQWRQVQAIAREAGREPDDAGSRAST